MSTLVAFVLVGSSAYLTYVWLRRRGGWRALHHPLTLALTVLAVVGLVVSLWNARRIDLMNAGALPITLLGRARIRLAIGMSAFVGALVLIFASLPRARRSR